jgi:hypothetical protein
MNVNPSQGVTWGIELVLKATTDIKTSGRNKYTKNSTKYPPVTTFKTTFDDFMRQALSIQL